MLVGGCIAGYFAVALATAYLLGRVGAADIAGVAIFWPIALPAMLLYVVADLGERK